MLGITSVPSGPKADRSAAINPSGPSSTGFTWEKAQCTSSTPPGCTPGSSSCRVTWLLGIIARSMWFFYPGQTWKFSNVTVNPGPSGDAHINPTCVTAGTR